jgi:CDP-diacylglycerol--glycerol-3-phosphate 3-phosphatidyltransferase
MSFYQTKERLTQKVVKYFPSWITPMQLSVLRLLLAAPIIFLLLHQQKMAALLVFLFSALLDFIDGPLARATNRVTTMGKLLDPFADKVMVLPVVCILGLYFISLPLIGLILGLELLLIVISVIIKPILDRRGVKKALGANIFGKYKMTTQVILVLLFFLAPVTPTSRLIATLLATIAVLLSMASIIKHTLPDIHDDSNKINL